MSQRTPEDPRAPSHILETDGAARQERNGSNGKRERGLGAREVGRLLGGGLTGATVFCFVEVYLFLLLHWLLLNTSNMRKVTLPFVPPTAGIAAAAIAGAAMGVMVAGKSGRRVAHICGALIAELGVAGGLLYLLASCLPAGDPHPSIVQQSIIPLGKWEALLWIAAVVGAIAAAFIVRASRARRPSLASSRDNVADTQRFGQRAVAVHSAILAGVFTLSGNVSEWHPALMLIAAGAVLFVLYDYPRVAIHPRISIRSNLAIVIPAALLLWVPLRDIPYLLRGVFVGEHTWQGGGTPAWHLHTAVTVAVSIAGGLGAVAVLTTAVRGLPRADFRAALGRGGWAILLLVYPTFYLGASQWLPAALLTMLYAYYLSANSESPHTLMRYIVIGCSWVPVVGLWQWSYHYVSLWQEIGGRPPLSSYRLGLGDPFMWPTQVGMTLAVVLPLSYGLYCLSRSRRERRFFLTMGILLFAAIVFTFSRSAWLATVAVIVIGYVWVLAGRRRMLVLLSAAMVMVSLLIVHIGGMVRLDRLMGREGSTALRITQIKLTGDVLREHPLLGIAPIEWDLQWIAHGHTDFHGGVGGMVVGWLQIPAQSGVAGSLLFIVMAAAFLKKIRRVIRGTADAGNQLLLKCMALGIVAAIVSHATECFLQAGGHHSLPMLMGAILGCGRAQQSQQCRSLESSIGSVTG